MKKKIQQITLHDFMAILHVFPCELNIYIYMLSCLILSQSCPVHFGCRNEGLYILLACLFHIFPFLYNLILLMYVVPLLRYG